MLISIIISNTKVRCKFSAQFNVIFNELNIEMNVEMNIEMNVEMNIEMNVEMNVVTKFHTFGLPVFPFAMLFLYNLYISYSYLKILISHFIRI